jgi:hypothetical protein
VSARSIEGREIITIRRVMLKELTAEEADYRKRAIQMGLQTAQKLN